MTDYIKTKGSQTEAAAVLANKFDKYHESVATRRALLAQQRAQKEAAAALAEAKKSKEELEEMNAKIKKLEALLNKVIDQTKPEKKK